jgi:uncharacterized membrane protein YcfT
MSPKDTSVATRTRVEWVDAAKGLAIILVVLHHAILRTVEQSMDASGWLEITGVLQTLRMPLFFVCAGLFAGSWIARPWRDLLRGKVLLFGWVFVLWVVIQYVAVAAMTQEPGNPLRIVRYIVIPVDGWFIYVLAFFFITAKVLARVDPRIQLGVTALLSAVWLSDLMPSREIGWHGYMGFLFFFLLGSLGRDAILARAARIPWWGAVAVVVLWLSAYLTLDHFDMTATLGFSFGIRLLALAAGVAIATWLTWATGLRRLGAATLPIYVSHIIWLVAIFALIDLLAADVIDDGRVGWLVPPMAAAVALALGWLLGTIAPRAGLGWLFETPRWLARTFGRAWPDSPSSTT